MWSQRFILGVKKFESDFFLIPLSLYNYELWSSWKASVDIIVSSKSNKNKPIDSNVANGMSWTSDSMSNRSHI